MMRVIIKGLAAVPLYNNGGMLLNKLNMNPENNMFATSRYPCVVPL